MIKKYMGDQKKQTVLSRVLIPIFARLARENQPYCVCGNYEGLPFYTENDVDIWAKDTKAVVFTIKEVCAENGLDLYLENKNATGSNLFFWTQTEAGPVTIHLDVLGECRWLSFLPLVKSERIEQQRKEYNGFMVATDTIDAAMHFMHPLTHFGVIRDKYKKSFEKESGNAAFWEIVETGFGTDFSREIQPLFNARNWDAVEDSFCRWRRKLLMRAIQRMGREELQSFTKFCFSSISRFFRPCGLFIAFVGADGCGKTTVQKNLQPFFEKGFTKGKIKKYYWRPFLIPRIRSLLPGGKNKQPEDSVPADRLKLRRVGVAKRIVHSVKLVYYCIDCFLGRLKYQGVWSKGGVVCFDRYWDDLIVFPERFGVRVPRGLVRALSVFVPKPDIVFYLHADAEVLVARKLELPIEEMKRQVDDYKRLAQEKNHFALIPADLSEEDVLAAVISACLAKMSLRYK